VVETVLEDSLKSLFYKDLQRYFTIVSLMF